VFVIVIIHLQVTVMVDYSMTNTINILYNGKQEIPQHKNSSNIQINKKKILETDIEAKSLLLRHMS